MSHINKEDRELSKRASGIPDNQHWKKQPTVIHAPSNDRTEIRHRNQHKNPWAKDRVTNNINGYSGKGPTVPATGNPNSNGSVFTQSQSKPQRTQRTSFLKKPGPPGPSRQGFIGKPIDLTKDDAEPVSHSSTVADDSEGSLNLKETEPSSTRIADDGRATKRLRSGEPSKAVGADTETEAIEEFPVQTRKGGKVRVAIKSEQSLEATVSSKLQTESEVPSRLHHGAHTVYE
ncbi:hypothetical protein BDM02DRAFT_1697764 [Thelephora ganbajun]|uniref:Uncharacterized protein n=1 Tax=Thelephora ganbajun TaxID=370292 RepID=A0ACB6ZKJ2_THEGA|nr:hypothetical protein BDM02DRAFT_1697764 [Thelephora ganbajun]